MQPPVSAFTSADLPKILALEPELVLTFSDLQAGIVADLVRAGVAVYAFNQRDVAGILAMIRTLGALVGATDRAEALARSYEQRLATIRDAAAGQPRLFAFREGTGRARVVEDCYGVLGAQQQGDGHQVCRPRTADHAGEVGQREKKALGANMKRACAQELAPCRTRAAVGWPPMP